MTYRNSLSPRNLTIFLISLLLAVFIQGCAEDKSVDELFSETLSAMEQAAQQRDVSAFMNHVSKNYLDPQSRSWRDIRRIAQIYFLQNKTIHIYRHVTDLEIIDEESAKAVIFVAMAGQPIDSVEFLTNIRAELMQFKVNFVFSDNWQVTSAEWKRAELGDFLNSEI